MRNNKIYPARNKIVILKKTHQNIENASFSIILLIFNYLIFVGTLVFMYPENYDIPWYSNIIFIGISTIHLVVFGILILITKQTKKGKQNIYVILDIFFNFIIMNSGFSLSKKKQYLNNILAKK